MPCSAVILVVLDGHEDDPVDATRVGRHDGDLAVDLPQLEPELGALGLAQRARQPAQHLVGPMDRSQRRLPEPAAVGDQHDVR